MSDIDVMRTKHLMQIRMLLGNALLSPAPPEEDMERNTDLTVLTAHDKRIACRIRTWEYFHSYRHQFTIRSRSRHGYRTEIDKVLDGWGDYMFYAFEDKDKRFLAAAIVLDLSVFRQHGLAGSLCHNQDGSRFLVFDIHRFPSSLVVASYPKDYWRTGNVMDWLHIREYTEQLHSMWRELQIVSERCAHLEALVGYYNLEGEAA